MTWSKTKNLVGLPDGHYRSILGYAGESLVIGRALVCGYTLSFKAWRDAKYDAVLDALKVLYRIEIKNTGDSKNISTSSGGRSGIQIDKSANSKEKPLNKDDCDVLIGTQSMNGLCWIIPIEVIMNLECKSLSFPHIAPFEEKWQIFVYGHVYEHDGYKFTFDPRYLLGDGLDKLSLPELEEAFNAVCKGKSFFARFTGFNIDLVNDVCEFRIGPRGKIKKTNNRKFYILSIWWDIFDQLKSGI
jgi:hypothetical protein